MSTVCKCKQNHVRTHFLLPDQVKGFHMYNIHVINIWTKLCISISVYNEPKYVYIPLYNLLLRAALYILICITQHNLLLRAAQLNCLKAILPSHPPGSTHRGCQLPIILLYFHLDVWGFGLHSLWLFYWWRLYFAFSVRFLFWNSHFSASFIFPCILIWGCIWL